MKLFEEENYLAKLFTSSYYLRILARKNRIVSGKLGLSFPPLFTDTQKVCSFVNFRTLCSFALCLFGGPFRSPFSSVVQFFIIRMPRSVKQGSKAPATISVAPPDAPVVTVNVNASTDASDAFSDSTIPSDRNTGATSGPLSSSGCSLGAHVSAPEGSQTDFEMF